MDAQVQKTEDATELAFAHLRNAVAHHDKEAVASISYRLLVAGHKFETILKEAASAVSSSPDSARTRSQASGARRRRSGYAALMAGGLLTLLPTDTLDTARSMATPIENTVAIDKLPPAPTPGLAPSGRSNPVQNIAQAIANRIRAIHAERDDADGPLLKSRAQDAPDRVVVRLPTVPADPEPPTPISAVVAHQGNPASEDPRATQPELPAQPSAVAAERSPPVPEPGTVMQPQPQAPAPDLVAEPAMEAEQHPPAAEPAMVIQPELPVSAPTEVAQQDPPPAVPEMVMQPEVSLALPPELTEQPPPASEPVLVTQSDTRATVPILLAQAERRGAPPLIAAIPAPPNLVQIQDSGLQASPGGVPPAELQSYISRGDQLLRAGDVAGARAFYQRAAEYGSASAAERLAGTYDPRVLAQAGVTLSLGNAEAARTWYRRAEELRLKNR